jgi:hypothetical protein
MTPLELIGPLTPIGTTYYDRTQVERGLFHGRNFPSTPPTGEAVDAYVRTHYYDLGWSLYVVHARTGNAEFLSLARKVSDSWWKLPGWIDEGRVRQFDEQGTAPRNVGISGLILRALDGRPEMWDWINAYTRYHFDLWVMKRVSDPSLYYGLRDGSFSLQFAAQLAAAHPDSLLRARYLADCENAVLNYYGRLQFPDGSWRWDDPDYVDATDGGHLVGVTQPFMVGLAMDALISVYNVTQKAEVKSSIVKQVTAACRHLYSDGPYSKQFIPVFNVNLRGFHYFYHGGTTMNPTKYEKGDLPADFANWNPAWDVQNQRQPIGLLVAAYGWSYKQTGNFFFKQAGDELWDSAYGDIDGLHNYFAGDGKSYNQNVRSAGKYLVWAGAPIVQPQPQFPTEPKPMPTPSPDNTKSTTVTDSVGTVWTIGITDAKGNGPTLKDGTQAGGGFGSVYKYVSGRVYVLGTDSRWYVWLPGWAATEIFSPDEPGVIAPTPPTTPSPTTPALPKYTYTTATWPNSDAARLTLLNTMGAQGQRFVGMFTSKAYFEKAG